MGLGKLFTKATGKALSKADKARLAKEAAKARRLKENQKKPINELQGMTKAEQKEAGMGTASAGRKMLAEIGGKTSRQKEAYNAKVKQYNAMEDKTTEKAQLLRNSIMDMKKRLGFSKGGKATKKVPVIAVSVGMAEMKKDPSKKAKMMNGGMVNGKAHMYAAGGSVKMNAGLRALQKERPDVVKNILEKS